MQQDFASLCGSRKRCGACLFGLDPKTKHLSFDIDYDWRSIFERGGYTFHHKHLKDSSFRGCKQCQRLLSTFEQCKSSFTTARWWQANGRVGPRARLELSDRSHEFELCIAPDHFDDDINDTVHPSICRGNRIAGYTGNDKALELAATWLARCRKEHEECERTDKDFAPSRLLFIGGEEPGTVYLVENPSSAEKYAALSHRWTEETKVARLKKSNIAERGSKGIPLSTLPQMMRDAIFVLRRLEIRHVWIDSMCIIQDDTEDWWREAARMGSIYANAELTIAAAWHNQSGQSLFCDRTEEEYGAFNIADSKGNPIFFRRTLPHFTWRNLGGECFQGDAFWNPEKEWPLLNRGWVYQDQLLSHRMLHFTRHELVWECNYATACECGWYIYDDGEWTGFLGGRKSKTRVSWKGWGEILREYSRRDFTFPMDRLPALAGVARAFGEIATEGKYISGFRTEELDVTFVWWLDEPAAARPAIRVPSWSWASVTGKVQFTNDLDLIDCVKFLDSHVVYHGDAYMGEVEEGRLLISGPALLAVYYHGQSWLDLLKSAPVQPAEGSSLLSLNRWPNEPNKELYGLKVEDKFVTFLPDYRLDNRGNDHIPSGSQVLCLVFSRVRILLGDVEEIEIPTAGCLVLYCVDKERDHYKRIGYLEGWGEDNLLELDWAMSLSQTRELTLV